MISRKIQSLLRKYAGTLLLGIPVILGLYLRAQTLKWHRIWAYDPYFYYRQAVYFADGGSIHDVDPMIATTIRRFSDNEYFLPLLWAYTGKIFHMNLWTLGIYLPLIIFVLQIIIVYKIGKDAFNWRVGFFASLFLSVMGAHVYRTHAGGMWKDTLGSLFMLMFLHAVVLMIKERKLDIQKTVLYGTYLALFLYLSIITFDGFGEFSLVVSAYLILVPIVAKLRKNEFLVAVLMVPVLLIGGMSVGTYWPWSDYPLKEIYLFVPFLIAALLAVTALIVGYVFTSYFKKGRVGYAGIIGIMSVAVLCIFYRASPRNSLLYPIYKFTTYLLKPELSGLSAQSKSADFHVLWMFFSILLVFAFLGVVASLYSMAKSTTATQKRLNLLFLILTSVGIFLGIATIRLTYLMSFGVAFSSAIFFDFFAAVLQNKLLDKTKNSIITVLLLILLFVAVISSFAEARSYISMPPIPNNGWLDAVEWMGQNIPNETVFNWWDWGHWIQAFGVKTTSDNIYQRGNEYAWFVRVTEKESPKFIKRTQKLAKENTGEDITIGYVVVAQDLLLKLNSLNRYYPPNKKLEVYMFRLTESVGSLRVYSIANAKLIVELGKNTTRATLIYGSVKRELKDIVVEIPSGQNLIYHYGQDDYIVYVTPYNCFLIPSNLQDTMLVGLLIFEQSGEYKLVYDNGYVKVYKVHRLQP